MSLTGLSGSDDKPTEMVKLEFFACSELEDISELSYISSLSSVSVHKSIGAKDFSPLQNVKYIKICLNCPASTLDVSALGSCM
jgi:hypothetical protein